MNNTQSPKAVYIKFEDLKWQKLVPELADESAEITIVNVNPETGATQLMLRCPKNFHAPKHWHSANETHYCVEGSLILRSQDGNVVELNEGAVYFAPNKLVHEAWTKSDQGALLFITIDGPWDIHFAESNLTPEAVKDMSQRPDLPQNKI